MLNILSNVSKLYPIHALATRLGMGARCTPANIPISQQKSSRIVLYTKNHPDSICMFNRSMHGSVTRKQTLVHI